MRVIKDNTMQYQAFHESLPFLVKTQKSSGHLHLVQSNSVDRYNDNAETEVDYLEKLVLFGKDINNAETDLQLIEMYQSFLIGIISFEEANIFLYDDAQLNLIPLRKNYSGKSKEFINKANQDGVLDWIYENNKLSIIPDYQTFNAKGAKLYYLIIPIIRGTSHKGVLSILTTESSLSERTPRYKVLFHCLNLVYDKFETLRALNQLASTYNELQVYQSKLSNDYKLSAIGELTTGLAEDILSPLQIISSYSEFLKNEDDRGNAKVFNSIENQISKIEIVVKRLVKFASINDTGTKIKPCDLNKIIAEYNKVIHSALKNDKYECILELEKDIPSILSHPNHVNQILTNIFGLVKAKNSKGGGILIQTKFVKDNIILKVLSTDYIKDFKNNIKENIENLNIRILTNLMKKHEGSLKIKSNESSGTLIELYFPLKRKLRS